MNSYDLETAETDFFQRGNPLNKLLSVSLRLLDARQTGILYGTNETRIKFLPTSMWDRGIMDRFDGKGARGVVLKLFGTRIVTARKLSPVFFYKSGPDGDREESDGIIAYVLRNCADYYKKGISVIICPETDNFEEDCPDDYVAIPYYVYDGRKIRRSRDDMKADTRILRQFKSANSIYIYLPDYGVLVINTADVSLLALEEGRFSREAELTRRLDQLIKLVETASLSYLGQLKGRQGAELLWRKEKHLRKTSLDLAANEKKFRDLYENAPIAYFSMGPEGNIFRCNRQAGDLSGYDPKELVGKNIVALMADRETARGILASIWEQLKEGGAVKDLEVRMAREKGESVWVSLSIDAIRGDKDRIVELRAMALDISQRKRLEKQLFQAQKMEAIGTLARGIAHDFNNVLSPVAGYAQMLLLEEGKTGEEEEAVTTILECARHAKDLVNQILTFGRQKEHELMVVRAESLLEDALGLVRSVLPSSIRVVHHLDPDSGCIKADPVQIRQVVMNLATNALHAMEDTGGTLEISLGCIEIKPYALATQGMQPGSYACIEFADTGHGIEPGILDNIFEPYFTTKREGKGSGIGLSVVHGIVAGHGGYIRAARRKAGGARFTIYLPHCPEGAAEQVEDQTEDVVMLGTGHVLLVDDDRRVARMHTRLMEKLGYCVTCYTESPAALAALEKDPKGFDLLFTDLTMPDLSGIDLSHEAARLNPDLPVVLCTGLGDSLTRGRDCPDSVNGILSKPVEIKSLSFALKKLMDPATG